MKNPEDWSPDPEEPDMPEGPPSPRREGRPVDEPSAARRGALVGLLLVLILVVGGLLLAHQLRNMALLQDCALSGRSNCR